MKARESIITIFVLDCSVNKARNYSGQSYKKFTLVNYDLLKVCNDLFSVLFVSRFMK